MAVISEVESESGVTATYWKIVHTAIVHTQRIATIHWEGYLTPEARAEGKKPAAFKSEAIPVSDEAIAAIYSLSLSVSQFAAGTPYLLDPWRVHAPGDGAVE